MQDLNLTWNSDLFASPVGDIALAGDTMLIQQRILRRLLTNPADYLWQPTYGAGLGALVGQPLDTAAVAALIRSQIFQETSVARTPEPTITISSTDGSAVYVYIRYTNSSNGQSQMLNFLIGH